MSIDGSWLMGGTDQALLRIDTAPFTEMISALRDEGQTWGFNFN